MQTATVPSPIAVSAREAGLYVHIPFCRTKCTYCDFNCYAGQNHLIAPYVEALQRELMLYGQQGWRAVTLYFGGGTPSLLTPEQVGSVIETARASLGLEDGEITLEANPGSVDEEYFRRLLEVRCDRVSIGMQSFLDSDLKQLARHHTVEDAVEAFTSARRAGVRSISVDLIYGLPDQSLCAWEYNVHRALELGPEHVSLYGLVVEEGTPLARQVARGKVSPPDDDLMADMYERAHQLMSAAGLVRYEVSNWARTGHEAQHNLVYWHNRHYIGAGAGAHGYLDGARYSNELLPARYIKRLETGQLSEVERETLPPELERAETVILGLRLDVGVGRAEFFERFGQDPVDLYGGIFEEMEGAGLLVWNGDRLKLTERGRLLSNEVFQRLLPA